MQTLSDPLVLISILLNVILMAVVIAIFFRLEKLDKEILHSERGEHKSHHLSKKIEEQTVEAVRKAIADAILQIEEEAKKQAGAALAEASGQTRKLVEFIQDQETAIVKETQLTVANSVLKTEQELATYKEEQIKKINSEITSIVFSAAREVLGRAISMAEHEDLVIQALERAKRDKFFV